MLAKCHTLHETCTLPPMVIAHLFACWAWCPPSTLPAGCNTAAWESQHQLVLKHAQEQNCHSSCWEGRLIPKRRITSGRKAKTKPITRQTKSPSATVFSGREGEQCNHRLLLGCALLKQPHNSRWALSCSLHGQVPTSCRDASSPCSAWHIPQLLLCLLE